MIKGTAGLYRRIHRDVRDAGFKGAPYVFPDGRTVNVAEEIVRSLLGTIDIWFEERTYEGVPLPEGAEPPTTHATRLRIPRSARYFELRAVNASPFPKTAKANDLMRVIVRSMHAGIEKLQLTFDLGWLLEEAQGTIKQGESRQLPYLIVPMKNIPSEGMLRERVEGILQERLPGFQHTKHRAALVKSVARISKEMFDDVRLEHAAIRTPTLPGSGSTNLPPPPRAELTLTYL